MSDFVLVLLGENYGLDADGYINKGTVQAVLEADWDGEDRWFIEGVSLNILDVFDGLFSGIPSQEQVIIFEAFFGADVFNLADDFNAVDAGFGNDTIFGGAFEDTMFGGPGDDFIYGDDSVDYIDGGDGFDTVSFENALSPVGVYLGLASHTGAAANDTLNDIEAVIGTQFDDYFSAHQGAVSFAGKSGDDTLVGYSGSDTLEGDSGSDLMTGGLGNDLLIGDDVDLEALSLEYDFLLV